MGLLETVGNYMYLADERPAERKMKSDFLVLLCH